MAHRIVQLSGDAAARLGLVTLAGNLLTCSALIFKLLICTAPGPQGAGHERRHDHGQNALEVYEGEVLIPRKVDGHPERGDDGEHRRGRLEVVPTSDQAVHQHQERDARVGALVDRGRHRRADTCREHRGEGEAPPEKDACENRRNASYEKPHGCSVVFGGQEGDVPCEEDRLEDHAGGRRDERQLPRIIPPPDSPANDGSHRLARIPHGRHLLLFIFPYLPQDDEVAPLSEGAPYGGAGISAGNWQRLGEVLPRRFGNGLPVDLLPASDA